jgi:hypothetical protein
VLPLSENFAATPKTLIGLSALVLFAAGIFGALNVTKVKTLRSTVADAVAARDRAEHDRTKQVKELKARNRRLRNKRNLVSAKERRALPRANSHKF